MELNWQYNEEAVPLVSVKELVSRAEGLNMLDEAYALSDEGLARLGLESTLVITGLDDAIDRARTELPLLVIRASKELLHLKMDEAVSRAVNILGERWLHENVYHYNYSSVYELEMDLIEYLRSQKEYVETSLQTK